MKNAWFMVSVAITAIQSVSAFAVHRPGWERPVWKADMVELDSTGHELGIGLKKILTLHKQDGAPSATMLSLVEEKKVFCVRAPCPPIKSKAEYVILRKEDAGCGSTRYVAINKQAFLMGIAPGPDMDVLEADKLVLVDHLTRLCDDYKKYRWEATVGAAGRGGARLRTLVGNPEAVYTIQ